MAPATKSAVASSATASTPATTSNTSTVNPNQRETLPPGDIPDTIAYVPFTARTLGLTVSIPEGWSRTVSGRSVSFTDKLNRVRKPRVHISYDVETEGAAVVRELPFVMGVMGDFSGAGAIIPRK